VSTPEQILRTISSILLVDWPSRDVPDTLAGAGYEVAVKGGPEPDNYAVYEVTDDQVVARRVGQPPTRAELIYCHRPLDELPDIVALAGALGSRAVWYQSGLATTGVKDSRGCWIPDEQSHQARGLVEGAGLVYIDDTYIADRVRELRTHQ
jgi:predicted CoA-binding protein